jgi:hypothetical protein
VLSILKKITKFFLAKRNIKNYAFEVFEDCAEIRENLSGFSIKLKMFLAEFLLGVWSIFSQQLSKWKVHAVFRLRTLMLILHQHKA